MEKAIGSEGDFSLDLVEGKILITAKYAGKGGDAELKVNVAPDYFIDKLAAMIPGTMDDMVLNLLKGALK